MENNNNQVSLKTLNGNEAAGRIVSRTEARARQWQ